MSASKFVLLAAAALALLLPTEALRAQQSLPSVRLNRTIDTLAKGGSAFGLISADRSIENARAVASSDVDFVTIDMEHGTFDFERLQLFLLGMTNRAEIAR